MWLSRQLLDSPIYFCLCLKEKQFRKKLKDLGVKEEIPFVNPGSDATTWYFTKSNGKISAIICFKKDKEKSEVQNLALLVHEAVHIWQHIKEAIGEHDPSKEFEAYSIQSLSQEIMSFYLGAK